MRGSGDLHDAQVIASLELAAPQYGQKRVGLDDEAGSITGSVLLHRTQVFAEAWLAAPQAGQ